VRASHRPPRTGVITSAFPVSRRSSLPALALLAVALQACGGGSPVGPGPGPTPGGGGTVSVTVFYDENGNGVLDGFEGARVPGVTIDVDGHTAVTAGGSGHAAVQGVPSGSHAVAVRGLPPYYQAPAVAGTVTVPQSGELAIPATLPIGSNQPNTYMAFGDSLTSGDGSSDNAGYRSRLQAKLQQHFGRGIVLDDSLAGTKTPAGLDRIGNGLRALRPAYTLILYGTNDWNDIDCRRRFPCTAIDDLRSMAQQARAAGSLPILSTLPPVNLGFDDRASPERQSWNARLDELILTIGRELGVPVADPYPRFVQAAGGNLAPLFSDHIHPSDAGYEILAQSFFDAITGPRP
jgi:lysophospholipase L1-like esterase